MPENDISTCIADIPFVRHTALGSRIFATGIVFLTAYLGGRLLPAALFFLLSAVMLYPALMNVSLRIDAREIACTAYLLHRVRRRQTLPWEQVRCLPIRRWVNRGKRSACAFIDERGHTLNGGEFCAREFPGLEQVARGLALQKNIPIEENGP
ncbi:MAG: hypothetical protein ACKVJG_19905 [Candidatus Latescibacterota bacterium]|jgi:hypothetical protein